MHLNKQQKTAVNAPFQPVLVVAGAGTGKTMVLIERIIHLIQSGLDNKRILVITFTNKARDEIKNRVFRRLSEHLPHVYTFHGFFYRLLLRDITSLGRRENFRVIDENDQKSIYRRIIKDLNLNITFITPTKIASYIGRLKVDNPDGLPDYFKKHAPDSEFYHGMILHKKEVEKIYEKYKKCLDDMEALDYDDLEVMAYRALKIPHVRNHWSNKFQSILIDEFQDTSALQLEIVRHLVNQDRNIFCVGDPDQSIYGFRGAKPKVCSEYLEIFPDHVVIKLEENYRSTKNILRVSNHLMNKNPTELSKNLFTNNASGEKVIHKSFDNEWDEVRWVLNEIKKIRAREGARLRDFAILYRNNALAKPFEYELNKMKWDFSITNTLEFFGREEIKVMVSYLNLVIFEGLDMVSFERIRDKPKKGIGESAINKFSQFCDDNAYRTILDGIDNIDKCTTLTPAIKNKFRRFGDLLRDFKSRKNDDIRDLIIYIFERSGYKEQLLLKNEPGRIDNIFTFSDLLKSDFDKGMDNLAIVSEVALKTQNLQPKSNDFLILSTIHQAKGLEYKYVFLVKVINDVLPSGKTDSKIEEERRLTYVAFTRAQKLLYITSSPYTDCKNFIASKESLFVTDIKGLDCVRVDESKPESKDPFAFLRPGTFRVRNVF